jgi:hypothetical protein
MERDRGGGREYRGYNKSCELQHGDHEVPPDLRIRELHSHDQIQHIDNKRLTERAAWQSVGTVTRRVARDAPHPKPVVAVNAHGLVLG